LSALQVSKELEAFFEKTLREQRSNARLYRALGIKRLSDITRGAAELVVAPVSSPAKAAADQPLAAVFSPLSRSFYPRT
jgi:hypothetical protein